MGIFVRRLRLPFSVDRRFNSPPLPRIDTPAVMLLFHVKKICEICAAIVTRSLF